MSDGVRLHPWARLGTPVNGSATALESLEAAGLANWNIRKVPLVALDERRRIPVTDAVGIVRDEPGSFIPVSMAVVGPNYHIIQNEESADLLDKIAAETGALFDYGGTMSNGKKVFLSMVLPSQTLVGGVDPVDNHIAAVNGHDGTMSFHFMVTPIRFRCENMLNMGLQQSTSSFRVRHSAGAPAWLESKAAGVIEHIGEYLTEFEDYSEKMVQTPLSDARFEVIIRKEFGAPKDAPQYTKSRADNKIAKMLQLFTEADTNAEIRGTVWAGLNAITEWSDHFAHTRRQERGVALAQKAIGDTDVKDRALRLMRKEIK